MKALLSLSVPLVLLLGCATTQPDEAAKLQASNTDSTSNTPAASTANTAQTGSADGTTTVANPAPASPKTANTGSQALNAQLGQDNQVYFALDRFDIAPEYQNVIDAHSAHGKTRQQRVEGHADERGSREYNLALGQKRAQAVANALISQGVPANQLEAVSFGEEKPLATGNNEEAWAKNRRADIVYP